jgi:hypothetical protein
VQGLTESETDATRSSLTKQKKPFQPNFIIERDFAVKNEQSEHQE